MNGGPHAEARAGIIDAWMQHPSAEFLNDPMFESLRRRSRGQMAGGETPVEATLAAMDAAGVRTGGSSVSPGWEAATGCSGGCRPGRCRP